MQDETREAKRGGHVDADVSAVGLPIRRRKRDLRAEGMLRQQGRGVGEVRMHGLETSRMTIEV